MCSNRRTNGGRPWEHMTQRELLSVRLCDLNVSIEGTWLEERIERMLNAHPDADFPSGECTTTAVKENSCVFLNKDGNCVVHIAESHVPKGFGYLKPFFCRAFPVCILNSTLCVDDEQCPDEHKCCGPLKNGPLTILDICAFELEFMLGADGLAELRTMARERMETTWDQS